VELVRLKVDVIMVSGGDTVINSAMAATRTIPVVLMGMGSDPVNAGFIKSLAHPGGNVTGITFLSRELGGKRLELLKEAVPRLVRVAVVYESQIPGAAREIKEDLPSRARELGLRLQPLAVNDANGLNRVFAEVVNNGAIGIYAVPAGSLIRASVKQIGEFATKTRLPSVGSVELVSVGGLARKIVSEISRIILDEDLVKAFQSIGEDKALLDKAKADPTAFLKKQGFTIPTPTEIKMTARRMAPTAIGTRVPRLKLKLCFLTSYTVRKKLPSNVTSNLTSARRT
jgi:hypothetical protein